MQYFADVYNETSSYTKVARGVRNAIVLANKLDQAGARVHQHFKSTWIHSPHNFSLSGDFNFCWDLARQMQPLSKREMWSWWTRHGMSYNTAVNLLNRRVKDLLDALAKTGVIAPWLWCTQLPRTSADCASARSVYTRRLVRRVGV